MKVNKTTKPSKQQQIRKKLKNPTLFARLPEKDFIASLPRTSNAERRVKWTAWMLLGSIFDVCIMTVKVRVVIIPVKSWKEQSMIA